MRRTEVGASHWKADGVSLPGFALTPSIKFISFGFKQKELVSFRNDFFPTKAPGSERGSPDRKTQVRERTGMGVLPLPLWRRPTASARTQGRAPSPLLPRSASRMCAGRGFGPARVPRRRMCADKRLCRRPETDTQMEVTVLRCCPRAALIPPPSHTPTRGHRRCVSWALVFLGVEPPM